MSAAERQQGRDRILAGAAQLLEGRALSGFTVDALARTLHMSKSTLYKHFDGKEHVLVTLVREQCDTSDAALRDIRSGNGAAVERLASVAEALADHYARLPGAVVVEQDRLPNASSDRMEQTTTAFQRALAELLQQGANDGAVRSGHPELLAVALIGAADRAVARSVRTRADVGRADTVRTVYRAFARGVLAG